MFNKFISIQLIKRNLKDGEWVPHEKPANVFEKGLLQVPQNLGIPALEKQFRVPKDGEDFPRVLIICSKVNYTKLNESFYWRKKPNQFHEREEQLDFNKNPKEKMFSVVYQTDPDTAKRLFPDGHQHDSRVAELNGASINKEPIIIDSIDLTLNTAVRRSISDPYLMNIACEGEECYLTGAINHYPVELAFYAGKNVWMLQTKPFSMPEVAGYMDVFKMNILNRQIDVYNKKGVNWFDFRKLNKTTKLGEHTTFDEVSFSPGVSIWGVKDRRAMTAEEFYRRATLLYNYGKKIAEETFR